MNTEMKKTMMRCGTAAAVVCLSVSAFAEISEARRAECAERAAELVGKMTAEERIAEAMMDSPAIERLGIPKYDWWSEALHGIAREGLATVFPQCVGMAATFDPELVRQIGDTVSTEARAKYNLYTAKGQRGRYRGLTLWSPNVNMFRDPRWGRGQETFGEDPYLSGIIGAAYAKGLQGDDPKYLKTAACAKHFAAHSGPERLRHGFNAKVSPRDLAEYYLPAFHTLVTDAKVEAVMGAYSAINGIPCCANRWLLTDLLRGEWGFKGHIVSDVEAVRDISTGHHYAADLASGSKAGIAAGLDLCSEGTYASLSPGLTNGTFDVATLTPALTRLFTTRTLLGQFDPAGSTPWDSLGAESVATAANRELALQAAEKSLVLVYNNGLLPVDPATAEWIGVFGPRAMDEIALNGNYNGYSDQPVTVFSGFLAELGPGAQVIGAPEGPHGDLIIACVGITAEEEGEEGCSAKNAGADRSRYALPESQLEFLALCRAKSKRVVAVVFGGSPIDLESIKLYADAIIVAWYPGEQGGRAIARTIFGRNNPSGRLPITFPKSYDDLPAFEDYSLVGRTYRYAVKSPAYPFGYGLSYTKYRYANARLLRSRKGAVGVSVDVSNVGPLAGEEVVQVYVRAPKSSGDRRLHHLEGVRRVALASGETKTVEIALPESAFAVYGEDGTARIPEGVSTVFIGGGQPGFTETVSVSVEL